MSARDGAGRNPPAFGAPCPVSALEAESSGNTQRRDLTRPRTSGRTVPRGSSTRPAMTRARNRRSVSRRAARVRSLFREVPSRRRGTSCPANRSRVMGAPAAPPRIPQPACRLALTTSMLEARAINSSEPRPCRTKSVTPVIRNNAVLRVVVERHRSRWSIPCTCHTPEAATQASADACATPSAARVRETFGPLPTTRRP